MSTKARPEVRGVRPNEAPRLVAPPTLFERAAKPAAEAVQARARRARGARRRFPAGAPTAWGFRRGLLTADLLAVVLALLLTAFEFSSVRRGVGNVALLLAFAPATILIARANGLYARDQERADHTTADDLAGIFEVVTLTSWLILAVAVLTGTGGSDAEPLLLTWGATIGSMTVLRAGARLRRRRRTSSVQNTVIVGAGQVGQLVADKLLRNPQFGCRLLGFVDANPRDRPHTLTSVPVLGGLDRLSDLVRDLNVERVVIAFSEDSQLTTLKVLRSIAGHQIQVDIVPRLFEVMGPRASMHALEGLPLVGLPATHRAPLTSGTKRVIDLVGAATALAVLSPLLLVIALRIKLDSHGPVLYWGERIGVNGRRFHVCKFRTMQSDYCRGDRYGAAAAEARFAEMMSDSTLRVEFERTHKLRHDPRVTRLGARLRRSYLDELPQLWNVLRGRLSLVGPRPITAEEFATLELEAGSGGSETEGVREVPGYWELDSVRPGLTGYWQVTGGSHVGYAERLRFDLLYVADWSLKLDLLIVAKTIVVLARRGAC